MIKFGLVPGIPWIITSLSHLSSMQQQQQQQRRRPDGATARLGQSIQHLLSSVHSPETPTLMRHIHEDVARVVAARASGDDGAWIEDFVYKFLMDVHSQVQPQPYVMPHVLPEYVTAAEDDEFIAIMLRLDVCHADVTRKQAAASLAAMYAQTPAMMKGPDGVSRRTTELRIAREALAAANAEELRVLRLLGAHAQSRFNQW